MGHNQIILNLGPAWCQKGRVESFSKWEFNFFILDTEQDEWRRVGNQSYIQAPQRPTLYTAPFSSSILVLHLSILVLLTFFSQVQLGISCVEFEKGAIYRVGRCGAEMYRARLKGFGQVWWIREGKIAFCCLLLAGERNFFHLLFSKPGRSLLAKPCIPPMPPYSSPPSQRFRRS